MCNLSQGVRELGRTEGQAEGLDKGIIKSIRGLMTNTGWSLEKAMETMGLSEAERLKYASLIQGQ